VRLEANQEQRNRMWDWIKRHALLTYTGACLVVTYAFCEFSAHEAYEHSASFIPPGLDPEMQMRMEFHASEDASVGFLIGLVTALPFLAAALLLGALVIRSKRPKR
jgi:hypothetical protein